MVSIEGDFTFLQGFACDLTQVKPRQPPLRSQLRFSHPQG
jgi:hypothetical protein